MDCNICGSEKHSTCNCPVGIADRQATALERMAEALEKLLNLISEAAKGDQE